MTRIIDAFEHERVLPVEGMGLLLGDPTETLLDRSIFGTWATLATSQEIGEASVSDPGTVQFYVRVGADRFLVPIVDWARLTAQPTNAVISTGNGTAMRAYLEDGGPDTWILVGRSDGNIPLVQHGEDVNPAGQVTVSILPVTVSGGLLHRMIHGTGQRHLIVMQTDQDARPLAPVGIRYNGVAPDATDIGGGTVWYPSGSRVRSPTLKTWFAFGEAVYNVLTGIWVVADSWFIFDQGDPDITFGAHWDGPWQASGYVAGGHHYARFRAADGSWIRRRVGAHPGGTDREWIPLTEQYVNGSGYRAEPYTARTAFDFHPDEWRLLLWQWEWDGDDYVDTIDGRTYRERSEIVVSADSIMGSPEQTRSATQWATRRAGPVWRLRADRKWGMQAARTAEFSNGGSATNLHMAVQFESSGAAVVEPITHIRFVERAANGASAKGWLRSFVL